MFVLHMKFPFEFIVSKMTFSLFFPSRILFPNINGITGLDYRVSKLLFRHLKIHLIS